MDTPLPPLIGGTPSPNVENGKKTKDNCCTIDIANWEVYHNPWIFHIKANRFLRGMVRAIVGTLLEVGLERMTVKEFENVIVSNDRSRAGFSVPAEGLFLIKVEYPDFF